MTEQIRLEMTSNGCPEQYNAFIGDQQVGYLRLRNGYFRVEFLRCGGETIYEANTIGDGVFDHTERDYHLQRATDAILAQLNPTPGTGVIGDDTSGREFKKIRDVLDANEFAELLQRCSAAAKTADRSFIYIEDIQFFGERSHAAYLQALASSVQMDDLARRLNPDDFAPGLLEEMSRPGRSRISDTDLLNTGITP